MPKLSGTKVETSVEVSGDGDLCLGGPVFLMAPEEGVILTDDGTAGLDGGRDRRGGVVGCRRVGVAGGVTLFAGIGVKSSRRSRTDEALLALNEFSAAILLLFAALAPPFLFLFLP